MTECAVTNRTDSWRCYAVVMRIPLLVTVALVGIAAAYTASAHFSRPPAPPAVPQYVDGQPVIDLDGSDDPNRASDERAARVAHRTALVRMYAAFDHPWSSMCTPEQHVALIAALNEYYGARAHFDRGSLLDYFRKNPAVDWQTADDKHIERLTNVSISQGYVAMSELDPRVVQVVAEVVRGRRNLTPQCDPSFDPWSTRGIEGYLQADREKARADAMTVLKATWARSCDLPVRRYVVGQLEQYYRERVGQQTRLLREWGMLGLRRGRALWNTEADGTIDALVRALLRDGYLALDEIHEDARPLVASMTENVAEYRCPEKAMLAKKKK